VTIDISAQKLKLKSLALISYAKSSAVCGE